MPILIAQLSDIHFKDTTDPAVKRARHIGAAISTEVTTDVGTVVLALCGDVAYSGAQKQFDIARIFFKEVADEIKSRHGAIRIVTIAVPGNHDCDFTGDQAARDLMISAVKEVEKPAKSVSDIVLKPLAKYFKFAELVAGAENAICSSHQFYHSVDLSDGDDLLRIHLLNSAWMSTLKEQQGSLHFPLPEIISPPNPADCSIAILHHPTRWFSQPHTMRPLRDKLAELASVVLVNHEHTSEATEEVTLFTNDIISAKTVYVAGGVIQDPVDTSLCNFNVLKVDISSKSLTITKYEYEEAVPAPFFKRTASDNVLLSDKAGITGPAGVSLNDKMLEFLDDPGAPISHPNRDPRVAIRLDDVFLYPDLWELDEDHQGSDRKQIKSVDVENEVLSTHKTLITGSEKSGRTSLLKSLFRASYNKGKVPLYLDGGEFPKKTSGLRAKLQQAVRNHYSNMTGEAFEQLSPSSKVVFVDNVHRMAPGSNKRKEFIEELENSFGTIVLCGDDLIKLDEVHGKDGRDSGIWEYRHVVILGFGEYLREHFVRKWLMLSGDTVPEQATLNAEVDRICHLLNVVIKKQLLPAYPLYLLVILQQSDIANASVQSGSFGKLFDSLVTAILNKSQYHRINIGDKYQYLASLAKRMYDDLSMEFPEDKAEEWHVEYWEEIEVKIDYESLISDFVSLGVLTHENGIVRFKYAYFFCFFMAYYLNRTLHEAATRQLIVKLSKQLHHRVSAEIVLFLAHLTGDPIVLDEMMNVCDDLFADSPHANLDTDVQQLNRIGEVIEKISIPDEPDENRLRLKMERDALLEERLAATGVSQELTPPIAENASIRRLFEIHAAYKTIQILGQTLRNIAGSATKSRKEEVIKKIVGLSQRLLGSYLQLFTVDVLPDVIEDMAKAHLDEHPDMVKTELLGEVCRHLNGMSKFISYSIIKHTTFSVGSENLSPTINRVLRDSGNVIDKILNLSFDLEIPKKFPVNEALSLYEALAKNPFSASLIRILMANHMYLFVVPYGDRQKVCKKLGIDLLPSVLDKKRKRLS